MMVFSLKQRLRSDSAKWSGKLLFMELRYLIINLLYLIKISVEELLSFL